jgi:hypothetical protein
MRIAIALTLVSQSEDGSPLDNQWERRILPLGPQEEGIYGGQAE